MHRVDAGDGLPGLRVVHDRTTSRRDKNTSSGVRYLDDNSREGFQVPGRTPTFLVVFAVALAAAAARPSEPAAQPPPPAPRVTVITDSVGGALFWATGARDELAAGLDLRLEAETCRKLVAPGCYAYDRVPTSALDTIVALGPQLGAVVVLDVGYNDVLSEYVDGLDTVMSALAAFGVKHVVWVTLSEVLENPWARMNAAIRAAPARWSQLVVADWAPVAAQDPSWFVDGIHMNELGAVAFARFLRLAVLEACGADCEPRAAATMLPPVIGTRGATLRWRGDERAGTYDLAVERAGGTWRRVGTRLATTRYLLTGAPGTRWLARVRARDADDVPGPWSPPQPVRVRGKRTQGTTAASRAAAP
jgi:hypothetical protein